MKTSGQTFSQQEFINRVRNTEQNRLIEMNRALEKASKDLTGRAKRLATRQIAIIKAELERRKDLLSQKSVSDECVQHCENPENPTETKNNSKINSIDNNTDDSSIDNKNANNNNPDNNDNNNTDCNMAGNINISNNICLKNNSNINNNNNKEKIVPPQLNTPQAIAKRRQAIREYHRKRKALMMKQSIEKENYDSARWFNTLLDTLRQDANRHELAAKNYAKVPELFTLHIEHSARAFELNRVLDMLIMYSQLLQKQAEEQ